jgi:hypothetical protein
LAAFPAILAFLRSGNLAAVRIPRLFFRHAVCG